MANALGSFLAYRNYIEESDTTLETVALEQGDRLVANLKTRESDDAWRFAVSEGSTSATVTATFAADQTIGVASTQFPRGVYPGVSESAPNISSTDTIRYRFLDDSDAELWDSTAAASGVVPGYMIHFAKPDSPIEGVRKVEATYDAASRESAGFCDVATLGAWPIIEPDVGFVYPAGFGWQHNRESQRTPAGRRYTARFDPTRRWNLSFDFLSNDESMIIDEMLRYSGGARQVFVHRGDLPAGKNAMHALVTAGRDMESRTGELRQQALNFEEFI